LEKASFGVIRGDYKLMHYRGYEHKKEPPDHEMFNLAEDPEEMVNIYKSEKGIATELKDILHAVREEANKMY
jgi:tRNA(Ser,Leu) C12 N-acetylase TAN1